MCNKITWSGGRDNIRKYKIDDSLPVIIQECSTGRPPVHINVHKKGKYPCESEIGHRCK